MIKLILDYPDKSSIAGYMIGVIMTPASFSLEINIISYSWNSIACCAIDLCATTQVYIVNISSTVFYFKDIFVDACNSASICGIS